MEGRSVPVVSTFNEWDPLEEIIVGRVDDNTLIPPWDTIMPAVIHDRSQWDFYKKNGGKPWPKEMLDAARKDIEEFVHILEAEGVTVRLRFNRADFLGAILAQNSLGPFDVRVA